jgi:hypothetical protein
METMLEWFGAFKIFLCADDAHSACQGPRRTGYERKDSPYSWTRGWTGLLEWLNT